MRTTAIVDCRYCPDPKRVAATSSALTLHVVAFLVFLIPITVVQIPKLKPPQERDRFEATLYPEQPTPRPPVPSPPPPQPTQPVATAPAVPTPVPVPVPVPAPPVPAAPVDPFVPIESIAPPTGPIARVTDVTLVPTHVVKPRYPLSELRRGAEGEVLIRVVVDRTGQPVEVRVQRSSGNVQLDRSALDAVRQWEFAPAQRNGVPVEVEATVPIRFSVLSG